MIYTITASYGQYSDRCDIRVYATAELNDARTVMLGLQESIVTALDTITTVGHNAVINCSEAVWDIASGAHWEGEVRLAIHSMELGAVSNGATFVEGVIAESSREGLYTRDVRDYAADEMPCLNKYEVLALPYEAKYG